MKSGFALIKLAISSDKQYIRIDAKTDVKDKIVTTCFRNLKILVHFSWDANDAINLMDVVSNPSFAKRVKSRKTVIART